MFRKVFIKDRQELQDHEKQNDKTFCTSPLMDTQEIKLRNRIADRNESLISAVKAGNVQQACVYASQMEELEDIITEWRNIRKDNTPKNEA